MTNAPRAVLHQLGNWEKGMVAMEPEMRSDMRLDISLSASFAFSLLLMLLLVTVASSQSIVLFLDAGYYLFEVIRTGQPAIKESTATTIQLLQQIPVLAALKSGLTDLSSIRFLGGLSNLLLPLGLTSCCYWALPADRKALFTFPLLAYLAGAMSAFFPTVTDAPPAAAYFWLLLFLLYFSDVRKNSVTALLFAVLIPSIWLHESFVFLGPVLIYVSVMRMWKSGSTRERAIYILACIWLLIGTLLALRAVILPRSVRNRTGFIQQLTEGMWIYYDALNVVAALSSAALVLFGLYWIGIITSSSAPRLSAKIFSLVAVGVSLFAVGASTLTLATWVHSDLYGYYSQFAARANATLISFPLSIMWLAVAKPGTHVVQLKSRTIARLVLILSLSVFMAHLAGLGRWAQFVDSYSRMLHSKEGLISWQRAREAVLHADRLSNNGGIWLNPTISVLLAEDGKVRTIIANSPRATWQPFDPCALRAGSRLPIVDYRPYETAISTGVCAGSPSQFGSVEGWASVPKKADFRLPNLPPMLADTHGLSSPEQWGRWTDGETLKLDFVAPLPDEFALSIVAMGFGPNVGKAVEVTTGDDGEPISFVLEDAPTAHRLEFKILKPSASVQFKIPAPTSPLELGEGEDPRRLGFRLIELKLIVPGE